MAVVKRSSTTSTLTFGMPLNGRQCRKVGLPLSGQSSKCPIHNCALILASSGSMSFREFVCIGLFIRQVKYSADCFSCQMKFMLRFPQPPSASIEISYWLVREKFHSFSAKRVSRVSSGFDCICCMCVSVLV